MKSLKKPKLLITLSFLLSLLFSCSGRLTKEKELTPFPAKWFSSSGNNLFINYDGESEFHPFFDYLSMPRPGNIQYFTLNSADSEFLYEFDLYSGKRFKKFQNCSYSDVWRKYSGSLTSTPFSIGLVPRTLDQLGEPQEVIVFGNRNKKDEFERDRPRLLEARVIGAVVKQKCESYPCSVRQKWLSKLLLVAVPIDDEDYKKIKNLDDLKKEKDWPLIKAYLENFSGQTINGQKVRPASRVVGNIKARQALSFMKKNGKTFSLEEMETLQRGCHNIYDELWKDYNSIKKAAYEKSAKKKSYNKLAHKKWDSLSGNVVSAKKIRISEPLVSKKENTLKIFRKFFKKYKKTFNTCRKFVKATDINEQSNKYWFLTYVSAFSHLDKLGYIYSCKERTWVKNYKNSIGESQLSNETSLRNCSAGQFDGAFDSAVSILSSISGTGRPFYRFIQYDSGYGGSHEKIFSWIHDDNKRLDCSDSNKRELQRVSSNFPRDLSWRDDFSVIKKEKKIIFKK